jgi:lipopolysaccharide/colanic/teichoic acid biosynthesis glycosyltransferase
MIAIKLEDGGSLFYRQTRVGKHGKHFSVLKFRSMVENAEKAGSPQWATIGDSRVTRVGSFLRKSRIDELPQLLNVIKGDMALVGPRPERPEFVEYLSTEVANFDLRHAVRPGLTGWAQISYPYGASLEDARWKTRYDLYYICNWTIWFDIAIIMQTVRVVLLAEGSR